MCAGLRDGVSLNAVGPIHDFEIALAATPAKIERAADGRFGSLKIPPEITGIAPATAEGWNGRIVDGAPLIAGRSTPAVC